ncbi:hypothetical protein STEG23_020438 [Scotinomys teguina]
MPLNQKDPGAPGRHWTRRTQEYPDDIGPRGPRSTPDVIGPGGPRSTKKPLDQEHPNSIRQRGFKSIQNPLDQETCPCPIIRGRNGPMSMQKYLQHHKEQDNTRI